MRAIITQRHSRNEHGQWVDSLENNYVVFFREHGVDLVPMPNPVRDVRSFIAESRASHIILSGGGDVDPKRYGAKGGDTALVSELRDDLEQRLLDLAARERIPVLGICRGMQFMNVAMGGSLVQAISEMEGGSRCQPPNHYQIVVRDAELAVVSGVKNFSVRSYHMAAVPVSGLAPGFTVFAEAEGLPLVEGMYHREHPMAAIQWHPERAQPESALDRRLIQAFRNKTLYWRGGG